MQQYPELPPLPEVAVVVDEDRSDATRGFLWRRSRLIRILAGQRELGSLVYDEVDRPALDAVVVVPYFVAPLPGSGEQGTWVVLRSAVRPPVTLRDASRPPGDPSVARGFWELPAGLVEPTEASAEGTFAAARRELHEETGFEAVRLVELGPPSYPAPGVIAERHYFFAALVDPQTRATPGLDGSPLEAAGELAAVPLAALLNAARSGLLRDAKTELGLRRFAELGSGR